MRPCVDESESPPQRTRARTTAGSSGSVAGGRSSRGMDDRADSPLITAIILTWNSRGHVGRCLDTLERIAAGMTVEVFVVDNGSTDGTADIVAARSPATRFAAFHLIRLATNRGTTWSRNLAIRQGRGRYLLVLDADTELLP